MKLAIKEIAEFGLKITNIGFVLKFYVNGFEIMR